ncbi:DUF4910 domain-containing protein [Oceanospirillum sediminis]|uniref:DUF4910 domain-containing protein n=1 Tax=Oceanospirillum sediminis TaxID=2760088 RepID=UPI001C721E2A|nr:DUF4910 domain-containing protein [Oceanospirillum sediminis]
MHNLYRHCSQLFGINRSLTGSGVRETLNYIKHQHPDLKIISFQSGDKAFDWTIPDEWNIQDAYIECIETGKKVVDFKKNNLHVVSYSIPVNKHMSFKELDQYLHSIPDQPDAIPYISSYYSPRWGFCLSNNQRQELRANPDRKYSVHIDSTLQPGEMNIGELVIPGESEEEIVISTYICHPSMANNELSGPSVAIELAHWVKQLTKKKYTYRFLFLVETIGSIAYLSKNLKQMKKNVKAGFVLTCIGDEGDYSIVHSRQGNNYADRVAQYAIKEFTQQPSIYSFLERGSDERQYCAPGVDLPFCTISRTKFGEYPEYHTSLDNLSFISEEGLQGGYNFALLCLKLIEKNDYYISNTICEPQLGKRGLYPTLSTKKTKNIVRNMMDLIAYSDGKNDIIHIGEKAKITPSSILEELNKLLKANLLKKSAET